MKVLITGIAGFIGFHLAKQLVTRGDEVVGLDNINDYYDVRIKRGRLDQLGLEVSSLTDTKMVSSSSHANLRFVRMNLEEAQDLLRLFSIERFDKVCNLAAQAGVRYSVAHPEKYISSNVIGFLNILEAIRAHSVNHLVYASSSSVYGIDKLMPFGETGAADHPASLYAVSKRTNELMAHSYAHLYGIPSTGMRFFTAYGPWGRPDMALFKFTKSIFEGTAIDVYNHGDMQRDFTYIDDIITGLIRVIDKPPKGDASWDGRQSGVSPAPAKVYNVGNGSPVKLMEFIHALEDEIGIEAVKNMLPIQPGDVPATWADCSALERDMNYKPGTDIRFGIREFVKWYRSYYEV